MPVDIYVDEHFDSEYDEVGDIRTVDGTEYVAQTTLIAIIEGVDETLSTLRPTDVESYRGAIESVVKDHHATSPPYSVTVQDVDHTNRTVTFSVETATASFALGVSE